MNQVKREKNWKICVELLAHKMSNILDKIFEDKQKELIGTKCNTPLVQLKQRIEDQAPARDIFKALKEGKHSKIIAEIKRRTPIKGELRENFNCT